MHIDVTTWYLEMLSPEQLRPKAANQPELRIEQAKIPCPELSRFLYTSVGRDWYWRDRLPWTDVQWMQYLDRPQVQTWLAFLAGTPAGYIELEAKLDGSVEIAYFGLLKQFIGQRLGGHLLSVGTAKAWEMNATRVWVHTCSLDSPYALANYQARGFQIYHQTVHTQEIAESC